MEQSRRRQAGSVQLHVELGTRITAEQYETRLVEAVREAVGSSNLRDFARQCSISKSALHRVVAGHGLPDVATLARMEIGAGVELWPHSWLVKESLRAGALQRLNGA